MLNSAVNNSFSDLVSVHQTIKLGIFDIMESYSKFYILISKVQDLGNFELSPMEPLCLFPESDINLEHRRRDIQSSGISDYKQTNTAPAKYAVRTLLKGKYRHK